MPDRKVIGTGVSVAAKKPPKHATIKAVQKLKMKPNRYILDGLRWNRDVYRVRSGGTLHVVNDAPDEGPHTFTIVKKRDLPKTIKQALDCKICNTLLAAHGADANVEGRPSSSTSRTASARTRRPTSTAPATPASRGRARRASPSTCT